MVINDVCIWGRLTADPELRQTANGKATVEFNVAVPQEKFKGAQETKTDFFSVVAWNGTAEFICKYFTKGTAIYIKGTLRNNNYTDKDGVKHYSTKILADKVQFGESKNASNTATQHQNNSSDDEPQPNAKATNIDNIAPGDFGDFEEVIGDSDLPF